MKSQFISSYNSPTRLLDFFFLSAILTKKKPLENCKRCSRSINYHQGYCSAFLKLIIRTFPIMETTPSTKVPCIFLCSLVLIFSMPWSTKAQIHERFLRCLHSQNNDSISQVIYTPTNTSYNSVLQSSIQNIRFLSPMERKPLVIVTPLSNFHVQLVVNCAKSNDLQIRVRSGGHDYEGLSYLSYYLQPFVIVDMRNLNRISIDTESKTAWIGAGVGLGELYHAIAEKSPNLGFPAGTCPTVGAGGHISGGGEGTLTRKYGLAADNVIDAKIVNADGAILDRKSMGEDLFWAIRGGGGASFGVILAYRIQLVSVPSIVTVFSVNRSLEQNATKLVHLWQQIGYRLDRDLLIRVFITQARSGGKLTVQAAFQSLYLGTVAKLLPLMQESFPMLGLRKEDCIELSWIESALYFADLPSGSTVDDLVRSTPYPKNYYKNKSDYVVEPISEVALEGLWKRLFEEGAEAGMLILSPSGGRMFEISDSETPYPHRAGNIYQIQHIASWTEEENANSQRYIDWIRRLYKYMAPFVSKCPRAAYLNYRDLDLGTNMEGNTSFAQASVWGMKYFKKNFYRLAHVKQEVDPSNFFRYEQSIPPFLSSIKWRNA
ncbi:tetrahydroberberine oxidase-like [Coffea arabica]|uniref:Tetrahydroberberine oxidase-like n=1 Tax=Coffea arabica TaxID=13443 RepID=A0A6P6WXE8_COFAR|nr:berberine bridge enzyme-like 18 [Coffea arabica]